MRKPEFLITIRPKDRLEVFCLASGRAFDMGLVNWYAAARVYAEWLKTTPPKQKREMRNRVEAELKRRVT